MDYLSIIITFITTGGLTTIFTARYLRKTSKIDAADKVVKFHEEQTIKLIERFEELEKRVQGLEDASCVRIECKDRKKAV